MHGARPWVDEARQILTGSPAVVPLIRGDAALGSDRDYDLVVTTAADEERDGQEGAESS